MRDVLVASMNKGQFSSAMLGMILLVIVFRMPSNDIGDIARVVVDKLISGSIVGWGLSLVLTISWYFHAKWQRRNIHEEMRRISSERTELQQQLSHFELGSSSDQ